MRADPMAAALLLSAVAIATLHAGSLPLATNDLHIYLAMGRDMAREGGLADVEAYSFTARGTPFVHATWGWSALAWGLHELGGLDAIRLAKGLAVGMAVAGVGLAARAWGATPRAAALGALYAWALMLQNVAPRGQTFAYVGLPLALWLAARASPLGGLVGGLVLGAAWAPLHGSTPAGVVALGLLAAGEGVAGRAWRPALSVAIGLALGPLLGPYGPELYASMQANGSLARARGFAEWLPPDLQGFEGWRLAGALALHAALLVRRPRATRPAGLLLTLAFAGLALSSTRFVSWFGLATALPLAWRLSPALPPRAASPAGRATLAGAALTWALLLPAGLRPPTRALDAETPTQAVQAIAEDAPGGRILLPPAFAGYAVFELSPRFLVSSDVRTWVYDDAAWSFYVEVSRAPPGWEERLDDAGVTHLLLTERAHGATLLPAARRSPRWRLLAEDDAGAAFARVGSGG